MIKQSTSSDLNELRYSRFLTNNPTCETNAISNKNDMFKANVFLYFLTFVL